MVNVNTCNLCLPLQSREMHRSRIYLFDNFLVEGFQTSFFRHLVMSLKRLDKIPHMFRGNTRLIAFSVENANDVKKAMTKAFVRSEFNLFLPPR